MLDLSPIRPGRSSFQGMDGTGVVVEPRADSWTQGGEAALDVAVYMRERALTLPASDPYRAHLLANAEVWIDCAGLRDVHVPSPALAEVP